MHVLVMGKGGGKGQTRVNNKKVGVLARRNLTKARKKHPDARVLVANDGNQALTALELWQGVQRHTHYSRCSMRHTDPM